MPTPPPINSKSSRAYLIRKGVGAFFGWSDTALPLAAPFEAPFHTLPVPPEEADPIRDIILHDFDNPDHGQTTWTGGGTG
jgi:hypothetical protein